MMLFEKRIQLLSWRKWKKTRENRNTSGNKRRERKVHRHKFLELLKGNQYGSTLTEMLSVGRERIEGGQNGNAW